MASWGRRNSWGGSMATTEDRDGECSEDSLPVDATASGVSAAIDDAEGAVECTLYPTDADEKTLVTTWLTARGDDFVRLDEMR